MRDYRELLGDDHRSFLALVVRMESGADLSPAEALMAEAFLEGLTLKLLKRRIEIKCEAGEEADESDACWRLDRLCEQVEKMLTTLRTAE